MSDKGAIPAARTNLVGVPLAGYEPVDIKRGEGNQNVQFVHSTTNMKGITIQINSVEALERLLGGDSELEVSLRQSVAVEMASRNLKAVLQDPVYLGILGSLKRDLQSQAEKQIEQEMATITQDRYGSRTFKIKPDILAMIKGEVSGSLFPVITDTIKTAMESYNIPAIVRAEVKKYVDSLIKQELVQAFNEKIAKALIA